MNEDATGVRIGELSRRTGVSPERLRAWESRYGLLEPQRSAGGFRLYGPADQARVERMKDYLARGFAAAEAAGLVQGEPEPEQAGGTNGDASDHLENALAGLDAAAAHRALDRLFQERTLDFVLGTVVLPYLHELGERWARGEASVAQEHFASDLLGGRLAGLARGWDRGGGPRALLACPGGERHDIGLRCFGLALRERGFRVTWLGCDTPPGAILDAAAAVSPRLVVLAAVRGAPLARSVAELHDLNGNVQIAIGGRGATKRSAAGARAELLPEDPLKAADELAARFTATG